MASVLDIESNELDEEQRHLQVVSVLDDGMDEDENNDESEEQSDQDESHEDAAEKMNFGDDKCIFKMLISESTAGAIIGKSGATISELQAQSKARIKVSQTSDFYPGTSERIILLSGQVYAVQMAQQLIWEKIAQFSKPRSSRAPPSGLGSSGTVTGKVLIPNEAGGLIIGRAGATIKAIQKQSGARVQISPKEEFESKISKERVLTVSGPQEACIKCTELIIIKLQEDSSMDYQNKSTTYGRSYMRGDGGMAVHDAQQQVPPAMRMALPLGAETTSATFTITINVPDTIIGYVLGKQGSVIAEIQHLSGAKVVVSPRSQVNSEDGAPADPLIRVVTITGSPRAAQTAQYLITQKLQLANAGSDGSGAKQRR